MFLAYAALVVVVTWPAAAQLDTHLIGFIYGDGREMAHHLWWFRYALEHGEPLFRQTLLGYPHGIDGVTLWSNPLQFAPGWLLTLVVSLPAAYNLPMLAHMAGNGTAAAFLLIALFRRLPPEAQGEAAHRRAAALIGGVVFMLYPVMLGHLAAGHTGLMVQWPLPLFALALIRAGEAAAAHRPARVVGGRVLWAAAWFVIGAWGHTLQAIYALGPLTLVIAGWAAAGGVGARLRSTAAVLGAAALGGVLLALYLLPVLAETLSTTAYTGEGGAVRYSTDLLAVVSPSFRHPLWGAWLEYPRRVLGVNLDEGAAYLGVFTAALVVLALVSVRAARVWAVLAVVAWVLSLGPLLKVFDAPVAWASDGYSGYITLPFAAVANLPGFSLARTPGRFTFALALAVSVMAGLGAHVLVGAWARRLSPRLRPWAAAAAAVFVSGLIAFDTLTFWPLPATDARIPQAVAELGAIPGVRAVFDVPWDNLVTAKDGLYLQTAHTLPLIAGQVTRRTPVDPAMLDLLQTLDPALLVNAGADLVIVHREEADEGLEARARARLGAPVYEDARYSVYRTPAAALPTAAVGLPPVGETAALPMRAPVFSPAAGWLRIAGAVTDARPGDSRFALGWDGETAVSLTVPDARAGFDAVFPLRERAYHTFTLAREPACPAVIPAGAVCPAASAVFAHVGVHTPARGEALAAPVVFAGGIVLEAAAVVQEADGTLAAYLAWRFTAPRAETDVRFVHVLAGPAGAETLIAQADETLGAGGPGGVTERVVLAAPGWDSAAQDDATRVDAARVVTGWYAYPSLERRCTLDVNAPGAPCSGETAATIGVIAPP